MEDKKKLIVLALASYILKNLKNKNMNKYERLKNELALAGNGKMKAFGDSMLPILKNGSLLTFEK